MVYTIVIYISSSKGMCSYSCLEACRWSTLVLLCEQASLDEEKFMKDTLKALTRRNLGIHNYVYSAQMIWISLMYRYQSVGLHCLNSPYHAWFLIPWIQFFFTMSLSWISAIPNFSITHTTINSISIKGILTGLRKKFKQLQMWRKNSSITKHCQMSITRCLYWCAT